VSSRSSVNRDSPSQRQRGRVLLSCMLERTSIILIVYFPLGLDALRESLYSLIFATLRYIITNIYPYRRLNSTPTVIKNLFRPLLSFYKPNPSSVAAPRTCITRNINYLFYTPYKPLNRLVNSEVRSIALEFFELIM